MKKNREENAEGDVTSVTPAMKSRPRLLNVQGLSEYLSLPVSTIYTWVSMKKIPGVVRLGRALRFDQLEIDRWLKTLQGPNEAGG